MRKFTILVIAIAFLMCDVVVVRVQANPTVHNVGPGQTYPSITAALTSGAVMPGDVIHVWDVVDGGTDYMENPVITIPRIKIVGEVDSSGSPKVLIYPAVAGACFTIQAPDVTIMKFKIFCYYQHIGDTGIMIMPPAANCLIMGNIITRYDWGILISDSPANQIIGNSIIFCDVTPPPPFCSTGVFIYGQNSINNVIRGNDMLYSPVEVQTNQASGNTITFNNFKYQSPGYLPQANVVAGDINTWCDPSLQKGNYWDDPSPQPPYIIDANNNDPFCSPIGYDWSTMSWDINRDLKCDIKDVATTARGFGTKWSMLNWNPIADVNGPTVGLPDGIIDVRDIAFIARKYGWIAP